MISSRRAAHVIFAFSAFIWLAMYGALSTRLNLLLNYASLPTLLPVWEPIGATLTSWIIGILFLVAVYQLSANVTKPASLQRSSWMLLAAAALPLLSSILRHLGLAPHFWQQPHFAELLWFATFSGYTFLFFPVTAWSSNRWLGTKLSVSLLSLGIAAFTFFWTLQAWQQYRDFRLGFNDFGHFTWRLANTWNGRGVLLESPTLPTYWDHFNPGILLIVPIWGLFQSPLAIFLLHAFSLSINAWLIYAIVRQLGGSPLAALIWGCIWLAHPSIGLWNLAFTYHWHPVTLGIPFFLAAIWCLLDRRFLVAATCFLFSASMEEGWLVIGSLLAGVIFLFGLPARHVDTNTKTIHAPSCDGNGFISSRAILYARWPWLLASLCIALLFVMIYKLSGLAEFQTARFAKLGDSPAAILLSPLTKPLIFFGQVLQTRNFLFVLGLLIPLGSLAILKGWKYLLATALPLVVLLAWDHQPAASLAFHYATTLMPIFFLAALIGAGYSGEEGWLRHGSMALGTCFLLSIFWGGMPWSPPSTLEADGQSYGIEGVDLRRDFTADGRWLQRQIHFLEPHQNRSVLATGRIAGHFLKAKFLETAGQFRERRNALRELSTGGTEWEMFDTIVLDHRENFQQSSDWTQQLQQEAVAAGFVIQTQAHGIVILTRPH